MASRLGWFVLGIVGAIVLSAAAPSSPARDGEQTPRSV